MPRIPGRAGSWSRHACDAGSAAAEQGAAAPVPPVVWQPSWPGLPCRLVSQPACRLPAPDWKPLEDTCLALPTCARPTLSAKPGTQEVLRNSPIVEHKRWGDILSHSFPWGGSARSPSSASPSIPRCRSPVLPPGTPTALAGAGLAEVAGEAGPQVSCCRGGFVGEAD